MYCEKVNKRNLFKGIFPNLFYTFAHISVIIVVKNIMIKDFAYMDTLQSLKDNIEKVIVGKGHIIDLIMTALISGGHVLLEDVPGTGKTVMAKSLARSLDASFSRIQFTPDLLPSDITGLNYYNQKETAFIFKSGPVFSHILLADEINRATPRTQSALLECMEEQQVTVDGITHLLPLPFFVIATQNPIETTGTFPLPEAQLDRFFMKISMGFPSKEEEIAILTRFQKDTPLETLEPICPISAILDAQKNYRNVYIHPLLMEYLVELVRATRSHPDIVSGISPRGSLALLRACKAYAYLHNRTYVVPEDFKIVAVPVLAHRLVLNHLIGTHSSAEELIQSLLSQIPVPTEDWTY